MESDHLRSTLIGTKYAIVDNREGKNIYNQDAWKRYIIRRVRKDLWELIDELGTDLIAEVEGHVDGDHSPANEWGL